MTLITEKCNYSKSPNITDVIRLLAFEQWVEEGSLIESVKLVSANKALKASFKIWCEQRGVNFVYQNVSSTTKSTSLIMRVYHKLPHSLQACIWLFKHLINRWPFRGVGLDEWKRTEGTHTFITYLFNLEPKALQEGNIDTQNCLKNLRKRALKLTGCIYMSKIKFFHRLSKRQKR